MVLILLSGCTKIDDWLDVKQNKNDLVPVKLSDFQALLDYELMFRYYPSIGLVGADNYYVTDANWKSVTLTEQNAYIWKKDIYEGAPSSDWNYAYQRISYANIVLDGIQKVAVAPDNQAEWDRVKGQALFFRAFSFYGLLQTFARPYDPQTAASDPGIPLLLTSDINVKVSRSKVSEGYDQVLKDLQEAESLLPLLPAELTRPSGIAVQALLAKVYLTMGNYEKALEYSSKVLQQRKDLYDFKGLTVSNSRQFPVVSARPSEILLYAESVNYGIITVDWYAIADPALYNQYASGDLRKTIFFRDYGAGKITFKGSYTGNFSPFAGIATNEVYLINAEANVRLNDIQGGLSVLNNLLGHRFAAGTFQPYTAEDVTSALQLIINERRKELPFTGQLRWEDLRRLNPDPRFAKRLTRRVNGQDYALEPGDPRYVYPIPENELKYNPMEQNER